VVDDESRKRLLADRERVRLDLSAVDFDLARGLALAERGLASGSRAALELALEAFRGELLEGLELAEAFRFQAWCTAQREAARRLHAQLLRALLDRVAGEPEEELQILRQLLELEPADEGAHRQAIRLLVALGRPRQALAEYDLCRAVLRSCLGAAPGARAGPGPAPGAVCADSTRLPTISPTASAAGCGSRHLCRVQGEAADDRRDQAERVHGQGGGRHRRGHVRRPGGDRR
jgi:tetratricopeptide (TPR) repeat protein